MFEWSGACQESFDKLKHALVSAPVLVYSKFVPRNRFSLETNASTAGLGAVLSQMQDNGTIHPVAYASRAEDKHERNYCISEFETLGLVWAVRYFHPYILGHPCAVYTDHAACLSILNMAKPSGKLARWALTVQEMDLTIKHKAGKQNGNADALSRYLSSETTSPEVVTSSQEEAPPNVSRNSFVNAVTTDEHSDISSAVPDMKVVHRLQTTNEDIGAMIAFAAHGNLPDDKKHARKVAIESKLFSVVEGVLYREDPLSPGRQCIVVPPPLRAAIMEEAHQGRFAGHLAQKKVYNRLRCHVWWRSMRGDVHDYCRSVLFVYQGKVAVDLLGPLFNQYPSTVLV